MTTPDPFLDPSAAPDLRALRQRVGAAFDAVEQALATMAGPRSAPELHWRFSTTSGWYVTAELGRQRLFYLFPRGGDPLVRMVFNAQAVARIAASMLPPAVKDQLHAPRTYPEGTLIEISAGMLTTTVLGELLVINRAR
jgi:hypothetical protein